MPKQTIPLNHLPDCFLNYANSAGFNVPRSDGTLTLMIPIESPNTPLTQKFPGCVILHNDELFVPMWSEDGSVQKNVRLSKVFLNANESLRETIEGSSMSDVSEEWEKAWREFAGEMDLPSPPSSASTTPVPKEEQEPSEKMEETSSNGWW